jgi:hypothetical protein
MLTYHPAFDIYHATFRFLLLTNNLRGKSIEIERLRIWDFYFVFPEEFKNVSFPRELSVFKKTFKPIDNPYDKLVDAQRVFEKMRPIQLSAIKYLAAYGFFDSEKISDGEVKRTDKVTPKELLSNMEIVDERQKYVIGLMSSPYNEIDLYGKDGFKHRTKLIDYKYDVG